MSGFGEINIQYFNVSVQYFDRFGPKFRFKFVICFNRFEVLFEIKSTADKVAFFLTAKSTIVLCNRFCIFHLFLYILREKLKPNSVHVFSN